MIFGTIFLVLGVVALISFPLLLTTRREVSLLLIIGCVLVGIFGLAFGLSTYTCDPSSPMFNGIDTCQGGVPWP